MKPAAELPDADPATCGEAALIRRAVHGDPAAVRAIIHRHNSRLHRVARSIVRDQTEAEDVVQETYLRAFSNLAAFRGGSSLSTWLTRIALNEAMGRMRKRSPVLVAAPLDSATPRDEEFAAMFPLWRPPATPEAELQQRQLRAILDEAIGALPEPFRCVFVLRDVEDLSIDDISRRLSIKPQTVKTRLHRARRLLKEALRDRPLLRLAAGLRAFDRGLTARSGSVAPAAA
jgi:RNA polymerase sigma-70 factor (ECF subfamily)